MEMILWKQLKKPSSKSFLLCNSDKGMCGVCPKIGTPMNVTSVPIANILSQLQL